MGVCRWNGIRNQPQISNGCRSKIKCISFELVGTDWDELKLKLCHFSMNLISPNIGAIKTNWTEFSLFTELKVVFYLCFGTYQYPRRHWFTLTGQQWIRDISLSLSACLFTKVNKKEKHHRNYLLQSHRSLRQIAEAVVDKSKPSGRRIQFRRMDYIRMNFPPAFSAMNSHRVDE